MSYKVKIDKNKCLRCGTCVSLMPKTFYFNKKDVCVNRSQIVFFKDQIKHIINLCPAQAIILNKKD